MSLSKRERVIRTLEFEEVDQVPVHMLGFEPSGIVTGNEKIKMAKS